MTLSMMKSLVQRLAKEGLYEIIFVLLMVHRNAVFMDNVFKNLLLEMILAGWRGGDVRKKPDCTGYGGFINIIKTAREPRAVFVYA